MNISEYSISLLKKITTVVAVYYAVILFIVTPLIAVTALAVLIGFAGYEDFAADPSESKIYALRIDGDILGDEAPEDAYLPSTNGYDIKEQLETAANDESIKGVMLEINSPGGTIYGSRAIADAVAEYKKKTGKPVVAFVAGEATSGAYWSAASTDKIVADFGTDVGGIGVIVGPFTYYNKVLGQTQYDGTQIITSGGIEEYYVTAGTGKDMGNPYRRLTPTETATLQRSVDNDYGSFVDYISSRRGIPASTIRQSIGALLYDPTSAVANKLIDTIGNKDSAYRELESLAKLEPDSYEVVYPQDEAESNWTEDLSNTDPYYEAKSLTSSLCSSTQRLAYSIQAMKACATK